MFNYMPEDIMIFSIVVTCMLLLAVGYVIYQKISYNKYIKELIKKHGFDKPMVAPVEQDSTNLNGANNDLASVKESKEWFYNYTFVSYETIKALPNVGTENVLYFVRDKGQHYVWTEKQYDYRNIHFTIKDQVETFQEIIIEQTDGTYISASVSDPTSKRFAYSKFIKWYLLEDTEFFNFKFKNGFDIILRSKIKHIRYRYK